MIKTLGLILKKQNLGETDRILTIFTPVLGKKRVIARAVRKPLSKLAGHLDTLMVSQLILTDEPDLPKITSAVVVEPFDQIRGSLTALGQYYSISRLVEPLLAENLPQQRLFQLTLDTLVRIEQESNWPAAWLHFLHELGRSQGVGITPEQCAGCGAILDDYAFWQVEERRLQCQKCGTRSEWALKLDKNSVKLLRLLAAKPYSAMRGIRLPLENALQVEEVYLREITSNLNRPWQTYRGLAAEQPATTR